MQLLDNSFSIIFDVSNVMASHRRSQGELNAQIAFFSDKIFERKKKFFERARVAQIDANEFQLFRFRAFLFTKKDLFFFAIGNTLRAVANTEIIEFDSKNFKIVKEARKIHQIQNARITAIF